MVYVPRIVDGVLDEVFESLPAIAIGGAKGVGKTATAAQRAVTMYELDRVEQRQLLESDYRRIEDADKPLLLDEWQLLPEVWDRVRRSVDSGAQGGSYLLTGSAAVSPGARIHSGAGRIVSLVMRPMTIAERQIESPTVSLSRLLSDRHVVIDGSTQVRLGDYVNEITCSGYPGIRDLSPRAQRLQLDSYISRIVERELPENGMLVRRPGALLDWMAAYGLATSTNASYTAILNAATAGVVDKPARSTVEEYRDHLRRLFVLDPIPAWTPALTPLKRLSVAPKHHLVDPALACRLARVTSEELLTGVGIKPIAGTDTFLGAMFESLVTQSIRVYAEATEATTWHLREKSGNREIDLIVEGSSGRVVPIEVKLSATVDDKDVKHLNWLHEKLGDRVVNRVVVNTGEFAYRRQDGVVVVPLALLGP